MALVADLLIRPMRVQRAFRCSVLPEGRRSKYYARVTQKAPVVRSVSDRWSITVTMASTLHGPGTTSCHAVGHPHLAFSQNESARGYTFLTLRQRQHVLRSALGRAPGCTLCPRPSRAAICRL